MNRTNNSIKNIKSSLIMTFINVILGFICQRIFAYTLGTVSLGINGLFSNIISFLSIAELGIGTAIIFNMYKPIAQNDKEKIKSLMKLYKKSYNIITLIIICLGIILSLFLPLIMGQNNIKIINSNINIYIIFYLFLLDTVSSYLLTYKRSILYANQKNYIINTYHTICIIIMYILQIASLILFKNFYVFLIIKVISKILENILINIRVNKEYTFLKENTEELNIEYKNDIKKRVKASIYHNIGGYIVLSTDSLIISNFIDLNAVGLYSNYLMIINALNSFLGQIFNSIIPSVGNLLVEENNKKINDLCDNFNYINFFIYSISSCLIYACIQPFIVIWLGKEFLFSNIVALILAINFYFQGMRQTMQVFAQAGGIVYENRFIPLIESILNIVFSIIFVKLLGISGVFIGTIISSFAVHFYSYPIFVYKKLLKRKPIEYINQFIKKTIIYLIMIIIVYILINLISIQNIYLKLIINFIISILIGITNLLIIYRKSNSMKYMKEIYEKYVNKLRNK